MSNKSTRMQGKYTRMPGKSTVSEGNLSNYFPLEIYWNAMEIQQEGRENLSGMSGKYSGMKEKSTSMTWENLEINRNAK